MNIRHLFIFRTVCEEMNFTRAAEKLYMTQPAVSHVIADLEAEAGTPLFDRSRKKIVLNERGRLLLGRAVRILELYESMEAEMKTLETKAALRVGSSITIAGYWLPHAVREFEDACGHTPLRVSVDSAANTAARLVRGEIDIALLEGAFQGDEFEDIPFSSYEVVPLCAPGYPAGLGIREGRAIGIEEFASMKLLLREKGSAIRDVLDGVFLQRSLSPEPYWSSVNSQALLRAAEAGLGVTVLPRILARRALEEGTLTVLPVEGLELQNANHIVYYKTKYLTEPMKRFIGFVRESKEKSNH